MTAKGFSFFHLSVSETLIIVPLSRSLSFPLVQTDAIESRAQGFALLLFSVIIYKKKNSSETNMTKLETLLSQLEINPIKEAN